MGSLRMSGESMDLQLPPLGRDCSFFRAILRGLATGAGLEGLGQDRISGDDICRLFSISFISAAEPG